MNEQFIVSKANASKSISGAKTVPKTAGVSSGTDVIPTVSIAKVVSSSHNVSQNYLTISGVSVQYGIIDSVTNPLIANATSVTSTLAGADGIRDITCVSANPVPGNKS